MSQFEQRQGTLRHCSVCTELRHDKAACQGCRSTGHIRSGCPFVPRAMPLLPITVVTPYNQAAGGLSRAGNQAVNRPYSTQPHLSQISRDKEYSIPRGSQSTQFGPELGNSDRFSDDFIPATQY